MGRDDDDKSILSAISTKPELTKSESSTGLVVSESFFL